MTVGKYADRTFCEGGEADKNCHRETGCVRGGKFGLTCSYVGNNFVSFFVVVVGGFQSMSPCFYCLNYKF